MKNTLRNLAMGVTLAGALFGTGCEDQPIKGDSRMPEVRKNQTLILHPDYLAGAASLGYTLLTDIDRDGSWDLAERVHIGNTIGDSSSTAFYKKGFGPAQSVSSEVKFVEPEYFKAYE